MKPTAILFVCLGNICRSPLGEGILHHLAGLQGHSEALSIASAGTGGWHIGDPPDPRSIAVARKHGVDISSQRGRQLARSDFEDFGLILGMDNNNVATLNRLSPENHRHKIHLFSQFATGRPVEVPDPYHGGEADFEKVYSMLFDGCSALLGKL